MDQVIIFNKGLIIFELKNENNKIFDVSPRLKNVYFVVMTFYFMSIFIAFIFMDELFD